MTWGRKGEGRRAVCFEPAAGAAGDAPYRAAAPFRRRPWVWAALALACGLAIGGCEFTRQGFDAVVLGQTRADVEKLLGPPTYRTDTEWVYTRSDPRDLVKVAVQFDSAGKVTGKSWQNPEKPWENVREPAAP